MRIGYLYDLQVIPPKGGNHRHVLELAEGFVASGHRVFVVDDPTLPGVTNYGNTTAELRDFITSIEILYVRIDGRISRTWSVLNTCLKILDSQPIVLEINSPANERLAYSWLGGKLVTGERQESSFRKFRRWFHACRQYPAIWIEERFRRKLSKRIAAAICVSNSVGLYAKEELTIENVVVLPNGGPLIPESEILERRLRREQTRFTVLYSGSAIYPWQGLNYLTQVISLAAKIAPDITFVLAVNQQVSELISSNNVVVLEGLDQEEVRDAICASDVCVALIPEWPWSKYGFHGSPTKLFEYMAFMAPVLTSNHSQMSDIIRDGENGYLIDNNPKNILGKLLFIKDNPGNRKKIARRAWTEIHAKYNWQHNVAETLSVFEKALKNKSR